NQIYFFYQAEDGIRDSSVTGVQTCALPIYLALRKNPLRDSGIPDLCGMQFDARDIEFAGLVAPDLEPGPVEDERIESRRPDQGGGPGERRLDGGQAERRAPVVIEDGHVVEK